MKNDIDYRLDSGQHTEAEEVAGRAGLSLAEGACASDADGEDKQCRLDFWGFPGGRGSRQPWRRRLWTLHNHFDRE